VLDFKVKILSLLTGNMFLAEVVGIMGKMPALWGKMSQASAGFQIKRVK
jgi:hypothetical protein